MFQLCFGQLLSQKSNIDAFKAEIDHLTCKNAILQHNVEENKSRLIQIQEDYKRKLDQIQYEHQQALHRLDESKNRQISQLETRVQELEQTSNSYLRALDERASIIADLTETTKRNKQTYEKTLAELQRDLDDRQEALDDALQELVLRERKFREISKDYSSSFESLHSDVYRRMRARTRSATQRINVLGVPRMRSMEEHEEKAMAEEMTGCVVGGQRRSLLLKSIPSNEDLDVFTDDDDDEETTFVNVDGDHFDISGDDEHDDYRFRRDRDVNVRESADVEVDGSLLENAVFVALQNENVNVNEPQSVQEGSRSLSNRRNAMPHFSVTRACAEIPVEIERSRTV